MMDGQGSLTELLGLAGVGLGDMEVVGKGFFVVVMGVYLLFALMVWRQVSMMVATLKDQVKLPLKLIAGVHVLVAGLVLVVAVVI